MTSQNAFIIFWWTQAILTCSTVNGTYLVKPGSPLSDEEYEQFIKVIQPDSKAKHLCDIRHVAGCEDPQVYGYDLVENHGLIPKGPICTESSLFPRFNTFCEFAMFRCTENQFYIKRIPCSDELLDQTNFPADLFRPPGINRGMPIPAPTFHVTQEHPVFDITDGVSMASHLRSLTDKLLVFSFTVCNQQPIRRSQQPPPETIGGSQGLSKTKDQFFPTRPGLNKMKEDLAVPDVVEEDQKKGIEGNTKTRKYKAPVSIHIKGKNPRLTVVSDFLHKRKDTENSNTSSNGA